MDEIGIMERELDRLTKEEKKLLDIINIPQPYKKYFRIIDEIKKVQGTDEMFSKRMQKLLENGAKIEKNLAKDSSELIKKQSKADVDIVPLQFEIRDVKNRLYCLKRRAALIS